MGNAIITLIMVAGVSSVYALQGGSANATGAAAEKMASPAATPKKGAKIVKAPRETALTDGEFDGTEILKTEAEWKKELSGPSFYVLRQEGTERAYTGALTDNYKHGTYYCEACGLALFNSKAKFDSGSGWPSFYEPIYKKNVTEMVDKSLGEERTEVECARCHSHLGHVFDDGPEPTGLRYCMNSVSLRFKTSK